MKKQILKKLSSQAGESISETLVATLIAALALVMLAGAVTSAVRIVTRSKAAIDGYYTVNNAVAAREEKPSEIDVQEGTGPFNGSLSVHVDGLLPSAEAIEAEYRKNEQLSGTQVIAYMKKAS